MKKLLLLLLLSFSSAGYAACDTVFWSEMLYPDYFVTEDAYGECKLNVIYNSNSYSGSSNNTYNSNSSSSNAFTLRDVERKCEVWRWSRSWGDVDCRGSEMKIVEQKCEVWFPNAANNYGEIDCRGSDLRAIENCSVRMWSESYGDIDC